MKFVAILLILICFCSFVCCGRDEENNGKTNVTDLPTQNEIFTEKNVVDTTENTTQQMEVLTAENTTVKNNNAETTNYKSGDNNVVFEVFEEQKNESNIKSDTTKADSTQETTKQGIQKITEPATDLEGWVTKWY